MKSRIIILVLSLGIIVSLNGCGLMSKKYLKTSTEQHRIDIAGKQTVKIDNIKGNIKVTQSIDSGSIIVKASKEIKVKKKFLDTPFDEIVINIDSSNGAIEITSQFNKKGEDGFFKYNSERDQRVDYEIIVPPGIEIEIENVNGNISSSKISNDLKIDLVNGEVDLDNFAGGLECEITNGSLSADVEATSGIYANTINGNITLNLNNYINANIRAETMNGRITDENLQLRIIEREKKLFKGKLGSGESNVDIKVEAMNGRIRLVGRNEI